ncbi:hypothetical protein HK104_011036 [Borealophlyctis nickersoniae]|nr:hypothetical protein HK104_011036 [Borealophlyctis nickersoniae]
MNKLKQINPDLKTGISVGGWAFNDPPTERRFSVMVETAQNRSIFINSALAFMRQYGLNGIDIDWEYPGADDRGGVEADTANFGIFMKELKAACAAAPENFFVSVTAPASFWYLRHFDVPAVDSAVDIWNVMTYAMDLFARAGATMSKIALGLGFYGRSFMLKDPSCTHPGCPFSGPGYPESCTNNPGTLSYPELTDLLKSGDTTQVFDTQSATTYMTYSTPGGTTWVGFDNYQSLASKVAWAKSRCLGGVMVWSVDQDTRDPTSSLMNSLTSLLPQNFKRATQLALQAGAALLGQQCHWSGTAPFCNGNCAGDEVEQTRSESGDGRPCWTGKKKYCCPKPKDAQPTAPQG